MMAATGKIAYRRGDQAVQTESNQTAVPELPLGFETHRYVTQPLFCVSLSVLKLHCTNNLPAMAHC